MIADRTPTLPRLGVRRVEALYKAPRPHWVGDGFRVSGYFSRDRDLVRTLSPFLLLDYHAPFAYPPTQNLRRGVGPHPHRGFETVSIAFEGSIAHHDSTGAGGIIRPGDVQWMTAGSGILHKEYHEESFARAGGRMHMLQLWVNLPAAHKMDAPGYQLLEAGAIPTVALAGGAGTVRVIAGEHAGVRGAARTHTPIDLFDVRLGAGACADFAFGAGHNTAILVLHGGLAFGDGHAAKAGDFVVLGHEGREVALEADADGAHVMIFSGEPIDEPIAQYGPFVMNTEAEIRQAVGDFGAGRFGELEE